MEVVKRKETACGIPDPEGVFRGLAQIPIYFHNAIAELIDNAIAKKPQGFNIHVDVSETSQSGIFEVTVSDDCGGISLEQLKSNVFRLGKKPPRAHHYLSEHGFGLKDVLAKIESEGGQWELDTRDSIAVKNDEWYRVRSPLRYDLPVDVLSSEMWPEQAILYGTIIKFSAPLSYLQSVTKGKTGPSYSNLSDIVATLKEHLGVFYRGFLGGRRPDGCITISANHASPEIVEPIEPIYSSKKEKVLTAAVGARRFRFRVVCGYIDRESHETKIRKYYYRGTTDSLGFDLTIGKRTLASRLFTEIWELTRHTQWARWCGEIRLDPNSGPIPGTLNYKASINFDDPVWKAIKDAIYADQELRPEHWRRPVDEAELREKLAQQLRAAAPREEDVVSPFSCFPGVGISVDIVEKRGRRYIIYETKAGQAAPLDVYQLKMYWDGMIESGLQPSEGRLVAKGASRGVSRVIALVNSLRDRNGKRYNIKLKTWSDFGLA